MKISSFIIHYNFFFVNIFYHYLQTIVENGFQGKLAICIIPLIRVFFCISLRYMEFCYCRYSCKKRAIQNGLELYGFPKIILTLISNSIFSFIFQFLFAYNVQVHGYLTLKQLWSQFNSPCGFSKMYLLKRGQNSGFL